MSKSSLLPSTPPPSHSLLQFCIFQKDPQLNPSCCVDGHMLRSGHPGLGTLETLRSQLAAVYPHQALPWFLPVPGSWLWPWASLLPVPPSEMEQGLW